MIKEIKDSKILKLLFYCLSFSFFVTFYHWISSNVATVNTFSAGKAICPPYFTSCGDYYFLQALPHGYSQSFFYVLLFLVLGYGVWSAFNNDWKGAYAAILIGFTWKLILGFSLTYGFLGNFDYYDMALAFIFLFVRSKEYFVKIAFVFFYFLASTIKIHESWILGNYLRGFVLGAPFISNDLLIYFTNFVIIMQIIGCWFLLSNNKILQRLAFAYFMLFHIYSGIIVEYRYIAISIPALFILFYEHTTFKIKSISKQTIFGYLFLLFLLCGEMVAIFIPGDQKKTLEGNYWGLYMFEANHQCISTTEVIYNDNSKSLIEKKESHISNNRCDPYKYWFILKTKCERNRNIESIKWTFDHSIDGHPYERIVDVENACSLQYSTFAHNSWIKLDNEAHILNLPVYKNSIGYNVDPRIKIPASPHSDEILLDLLKKFYSLLWLLIVFSFTLYLVYYSVNGYGNRNE
jgi:hypothetical protein